MVVCCGEGHEGRDGAVVVEEASQCRDFRVQKTLV